MADRVRLYFDELRVGQTFVTTAYTVSEEEVLRFAREFDPQPFHLDHEAARASVFNGLTGSGWHTAAISMRLLVASGPPLAGGILGVGGEIAWTTPMRPGDTLQVHSEVVALTASTSRRNRGTAVIRNETRNQRGEVVQTFTARVIVPLKSAGP
jgi:acyl dehydratase